MAHREVCDCGIHIKQEGYTMYYEEKIIDGVLMSRTDPNEAWKAKTQKEMSNRIIDQKNTIIRLRKALRKVANAANGALDQL